MTDVEIRTSLTDFTEKQYWTWKGRIERCYQRRLAPTPEQYEAFDNARHRLFLKYGCTFKLKSK